MNHAKSPAPTRGNYQTLSWGLVSIPVQVLTGLEKGAAVPRKMFTPDGHPVGSQSYDKETGAVIAADAIVKKAEASDGTLVPLTDEEIETAVGGATKGVASIHAFVPLAALGREYVVTGFDQVRPAARRVGTKKVDDPAGIQAFALLMAAMRKRGVAALVKFAGRSGSKFAAITPDGRWLTLAYAEQVRGAVDLPTAEVAENLLAMGLSLIDQVGVDTPVLEDTDGAAVQAYVDVKAVTGVAPDAPAEAQTEVVDLMDALTASLKAANVNAA